MIEGNKINHRDQSSINKSNQNFIDFLQQLRKQRKQRLVPIPHQNIQNPNSPSQNKNLEEVNHSEVLQSTSQSVNMNPSKTFSKQQPPLFNKQMGDNALKYRSRVNMHYKSFFHHYQFSPNWFSQTQKQLDQYLKSSRVIPERQTRQNISLNLSRLGRQGPTQNLEANKDKRNLNGQNGKDKVGPQKQWIVKTARQRKQSPRYEDQDNMNAEQSYYNKNRRKERETKSQYFQQNKKSTKDHLQLDLFQGKGPYRRPRQSSNDLQHCRQFSYPFGQQMPLFAQTNQPSKRRIKIRPDPRKVELKPIQKSLSDELLEQQPLRLKW